MRVQAGTDTASASLPVRSRRPLGAGLSGARGTVDVYRAVGGLPQRALLGGQLRATEDGWSTVQVLLADRPAEAPRPDLSRRARPRPRPRTVELAFQLAVRMLVETLRLGADADDNTVEAAGRALVGRLD